MPLSSISHDSLPYIDPDPTPSERATASRLITAALTPLPSSSSALHPSIPPLPPPPPPTLLATEFPRFEAHPHAPWQDGIDTARYEPPSAPSRSTSTSPAALAAEYTAALQQTQTSSSYLHERTTNLRLLEQFGASAWLAGNERLEGVLRGLEMKLKAVREEEEGVNRGRRDAQEAVRGELQGLEEAWRGGVDRALRAKVEGERVRGEILELRRRQGS